MSVNRLQDMHTAPMYRTIVATLIVGSACGGTTLQPTAVVPPTTATLTAAKPPLLRADIPWTGNNRDTLTGWMDELTTASKHYDANHKPVALFDFDGTLLEGDIGDAITHHLIATGNVLQPPNKTGNGRANT